MFKVTKFIPILAYSPGNSLYCQMVRAKIRWRNRWTNGRVRPPRHRILTSVDGTACPYKEERLENGELDTSLFCPKFNGPGLNYEIVLGIYTGLVCSVKGPYKFGEDPDLRIALQGLVPKLERNDERCIADGTYRNAVFVLSRRGLCREALGLIRVMKARHETFNSRMKRFAMFNCLRGFRHDMEVHGICFHAIANMVEIEIEVESPLFRRYREINAFDRWYRRHHGR